MPDNIEHDRIELVSVFFTNLGFKDGMSADEVARHYQLGRRLSCPEPFRLHTSRTGHPSLKNKSIKVQSHHNNRLGSGPGAA